MNSKIRLNLINFKTLMNKNIFVQLLNDEITEDRSIVNVQ